MNETVDKVLRGIIWTSANLLAADRVEFVKDDD